MRKIVSSLLLFSLLCAFVVTEKKSISIEQKKVSSGNNYTIIYQNACKIDFTNKRPKETDVSVQLCIAGAFTQLSDYKIDGVYLCDGEVGNQHAVNKRLGGAIKMMDGKASIFPTNKGALLSSELIKEVAQKKGSLFQQIQLIENGKAASFIDKAMFQRRAIVVFKNGKTAVTECAETITLAQFSKDLVELGVKDALYTDMGGWDEGWYIDPLSKKKVIIGQIRSNTAQQSNWVVFKK